MQSKDINVAQIASGSWVVSEEADRLSKRTFKIKSHAISFGKARAFSNSSRLYVHGPDGIGILQTKESLTCVFRGNATTDSN